MGETTAISWTNHTFNPWIGCTKVSPACDHCYAEALMATRWGKVEWGPGKKRLLTSDANWRDPLKWNARALADGVRRRVFCASLADVFDAEVNPLWRMRLFKLVWECTALDWLLLTKRPLVAQKFFEGYLVPPNVWLGTTAENHEMAVLRWKSLAQVPARVRFFSYEPALGPVDWDDVYASGPAGQWVDWIICGGESGAGCRAMPEEWANETRMHCYKNNVAFFMKQMGGHPNKRDQLRDFPVELRIRQFPRMSA